MNVIVFLRKAWGKIMNTLYHYQYKHITKTSKVHYSAKVYNPDNLYMEENTNIEDNAFILNSRAKLYFKKYSGAAAGLTVITGNHMSIPGKHHKMVTDKDKDELDTNHEFDKDVIIGEDVWIGVNSTILAGVTVGRGAIVGAGSVLRYNVPPYAIVAGNPAKIVGFRFTPGIIIQHEEELYPKEERLPEDFLQENYKKYYISRIKGVQEYLKL